MEKKPQTHKIDLIIRDAALTVTYDVIKHRGVEHLDVLSATYSDGSLVPADLLDDLTYEIMESIDNLLEIGSRDYGFMVG